MRVRINEFTISGLKEATKYCHKHKKRIYATVNILAHNNHIRRATDHIKKLKNIGVNGIIISDPGILVVVKKIWPKCKIHLSTQANCTNWQSAKFWQNQGVERIILGREVTLNEIKDINKKCAKLELEYFVHGAMCMSYSGRCFLSKYFLDRSANLGDCAQPCRWKYYIQEEQKQDKPLEIVEEKHGSYILNSKDLCLIKHLDDLINAGITNFKIEGRAKSVYYQAVITGVYSRLINNIENASRNEIDFLFDELNTKLFHRGYTTGFLLGGKSDQSIKQTHNKCNWEFCGQVIKTKKYEIRSKKLYSIFIKVHNTLKVGDDVEIVIPNYDIIKMRIKKIKDGDTDIEIKEAHGGGGKVVIIESKSNIPKYSVMRRRI